MPTKQAKLILDTIISHIWKRLVRSVVIKRRGIFSRKHAPVVSKIKIKCWDQNKGVPETGSRSIQYLRIKCLKWIWVSRNWYYERCKFRDNVPHTLTSMKFFALKNDTPLRCIYWIQQPAECDFSNVTWDITMNKEPERVPPPKRWRRWFIAWRGWFQSIYCWYN